MMDKGCEICGEEVFTGCYTCCEYGVNLVCSACKKVHYVCEPCYVNPIFCTPMVTIYHKKLCRECADVVSATAEEDTDEIPDFSDFDEELFRVAPDCFTHAPGVDYRTFTLTWKSASGREWTSGAVPAAEIGDLAAERGLKIALPAFVPSGIAAAAASGDLGAIALAAIRWQNCPDGDQTRRGVINALRGAARGGHVDIFGMILARGVKLPRLSPSIINQAKKIIADRPAAEQGPFVNALGDVHAAMCARRCLCKPYNAWFASTGEVTE